MRAPRSNRPVALPDRLRAACRPRERLLAAALALLAGGAVFLVATEVFPYHSNNHDEGVYLQQAAMLLEGQLQLFPGEFGTAVKPWFFVDAGDSFYPKYQPLPAGFYAIGMALFGDPRIILAVVAAGNTALVYILGSVAFDRRVGLLAATGFGFAPMTLISSSVFLAYAPTTLFNLGFAVCYLRGYHTGRKRPAALAGVAIGIAFLMRPFTAVLFALPFLAHALWEMGRAFWAEYPRRSGDGRTFEIPDAVGRQFVTAAFGLVFVALALVYNAVLTGSALVFPYEAFAPMDGPGFGRRQILNHSIEYSPLVALEANSYVLRYLLTRWVPGGIVGTLLAVGGLMAAARARGLIPKVPRIDIPGDPTARVLLAGLFVSVPVGNVFFWGNFNILATASDPTDGLLGQFGPVYHFDLLAPVAIFAAAGALTLWRSRQYAVETVPFSLPAPAQRRAIGIVVLLTLALLAGGVNAVLVSESLERNAASTESYEQAYAPFEEREFDNALVFMPTPYGDWLNHPFQYLRNDPNFDGDSVYVMERSPAERFEILGSVPDRQPYRYTYRGEWTADPEEREVIPRLEKLAVHEDERLAAETVVGVPDRVSHAVVRIETEDGYATQIVDDPADRLPVEWSLNSTHAALDSVDGSAVAGSAVTESVGEVVLTVRLVQSGAGTLTYRQATAAQRTDVGVAAIWPPERTVCPAVDDCGREGTYLPDQPEHHREGVVFETSIESVDGEN